MDVYHQPRSGESIILRPSGNNDEIQDWENHVHTETGVVPPEARCAIVHPLGIVMNFCNADPELDKAPGKGWQLILMSGRPGEIGWRYDNLGDYFVGLPDDDIERFVPNYRVPLEV